MIRIAVTGPESSGKTTLATALAEHFSASLHLEFARTYLDQLERPYELADLDIIARGHLAQFQQDSSPLQIIDTDFIVMHDWSQRRFGVVTPYIETLVAQNYFDLHLLCTPDMPWEFDHQREYPNDRDALFSDYHALLKKKQKPFLIVSGPESERNHKSIAAIRALFT